MATLGEDYKTRYACAAETYSVRRSVEIGKIEQD